LIAAPYDANDNPVPNERIPFAIEPVEVMPYSDILSGAANNVILTRYDLTSLSPYFRTVPTYHKYACPTSFGV